MAEESKSQITEESKSPLAYQYIQSAIVKTNCENRISKSVFQSLKPSFLKVLLKSIFMQFLSLIYWQKIVIFAYARFPKILMIT